MRPIAIAVLVVSSIAGCGGPDAKAPNPTRPIDERRAVPLIAQAYKDSGAQASDGRDMRLVSGKTLHVDVGTVGHKYGVAYLTTGDASSLDAKTDLPPHTPGGDLPVVQGTGPDADAVILVLFDSDYLWDDLMGAEHEATNITAEKKLTRDVRDFVVQARSRNLP